jgi:MoaA/NifB/PqqE/SkfB family radical SAM enzyme
MISPTSLRIAACGRCQLRCPLCNTTAKPLPAGEGKLRFDNFKQLLDRNPQIKKLELAGKGELFLNERLPEMLRYAHERNVATSMGAGANLNSVSDETLKSLVLCQTERLRCAVDGVTQQTYGQYRLGGNLRKVIGNIQKINAFKEHYRSAKPQLVFQFVVFRHNQHEIPRAALLAKMLKMDFFLRVNYSPCFSALSAEQKAWLNNKIGYVSREDYLNKTGNHFLRNVCYHLWRDPQIRWDGAILGCACNNFGTFPGNVFKEDLVHCINSEPMSYARDMLMGRKPPHEDIPCVRCDAYKSIARLGNWITEAEIRASGSVSPAGAG